MSSLECEAMFFALFWSAHWPYFGHPRGFVVGQNVGRPFQAVIDRADTTVWKGRSTEYFEYRVRSSARAELQTEVYQLKPEIFVRRPFQAVENKVSANDGLERPSYEKDTR